MSASSSNSTDYIVNPAADLSSDPITVVMWREYERADPAKRRAMVRMIERIGAHGMPTEEAGRLFFTELGMTDKKARAAVRKALALPAGSWRNRMLD